MATYPILFSFHDVVAGSGFWALVVKDGRAILDESEDGAWFYGVDPGGMAGHGATVQEANQDFRAGYRSVLADFAEEAQDFRSFKALVTEFLTTVNRPNEDLWKEATKRVKSGELKLDWLPQRSAQLKRHFKIVELKEPAKAINDPSFAESQSLAA